MDFGLESNNQAVAEQLKIDYRSADLEPADRALCDFAVAVTLNPGGLEPANLEALRVFGFEDEAILIAVQVIGYFNYINRVADALGVDDEEGMTPDRTTWFATKGRFTAPSTS